MTALATRLPGSQGGWIFTPKEIRTMRTFVVERAGHQPLARGDVGSAAAAWIETNVRGGVAAFLSGGRELLCT